MKKGEWLLLPYTGSGNQGKTLPSFFLIVGSALCKKTRSLAVCGADLAQSFAIVSPALEKTLSDGVEVAGIQRR